MFDQQELDQFITNALHEDVRGGDYSSLASIDATTQGKARLLVKDNGILCGLDVAKAVFAKVDADLKLKFIYKKVLLLNMVMLLFMCMVRQFLF